MIMSPQRKQGKSCIPNWWLQRGKEEAEAQRGAMINRLAALRPPGAGTSSPKWGL